jgi:hypothetical protein
MKNMTLLPMRAVKNGYARIRSRRRSRQMDASGIEVDNIEDAEEMALGGDEQDEEDGEDESLQWAAMDDADEEEEVEEVEAQEDEVCNTPTVGHASTVAGGVHREAALGYLDASGHGTVGPAHVAAVTSQEVADILRDSTDGVIVLVNVAARRWALLHAWLNAHDDQACKPRSSSSLRRKAVAAPGTSAIRAALRGIMAYRQELDLRQELEDEGAVGMQVRVMILGGDLYTHNVVREWVRVREVSGHGAIYQHKENAAILGGASDNYEGVCFYPVPLGGRGRSDGIGFKGNGKDVLASLLAGRDAQYGALFASDHWAQLWEAFASGDGGMPAVATVGPQIESLLVRYLQVCVCCVSVCPGGVGVGVGM